MNMLPMYVFNAIFHRYSAVFNFPIDVHLDKWTGSHGAERIY